jgi:hypothetical protein
MPWRHMGKWRCSAIILDLDTRWRWMVNFMPLLLYSSGENLQYPLNRRLGGPQSQSGGCREKEKFLAPTRNQTLAIHPLAHHYTDWAIMAEGRLIETYSKKGEWGRWKFACQEPTFFKLTTNKKYKKAKVCWKPASIISSYSILWSFPVQFTQQYALWLQRMKINALVS